MSDDTQTVKSRLFESLVTAFTFVAAISWRETLVKTLEALIPDEANRLWAEFGVTILITAIAVTFIFVILKTEHVIDRTFENEEEDDKDNSK